MKRFLILTRSPLDALNSALVRGSWIFRIRARLVATNSNCEIWLVFGADRLYKSSIEPFADEADLAFR
jgi:hypothetical protein